MNLSDLSCVYRDFLEYSFPLFSSFAVSFPFGIKQSVFLSVLVSMIDFLEVGAHCHHRILFIILYVLAAATHGFLSK